MSVMKAKEISKLKYTLAENWVAEMPRNRIEMRASGSTTAAAGKVSVWFVTLVMVMVQVLKFAQVGRIISKDPWFWETNSVWDDCTSLGFYASLNQLPLTFAANSFHKQRDGRGTVNLTFREWSGWMVLKNYAFQPATNRTSNNPCVLPMCLELWQPSFSLEYQNNTHVSSITEHKWQTISNTQ